MSTELTVVEQKSNPLMTLQSWDELLSRAEYFAKSQLIPAPLRGKPADVAIILQYGVELGIPPLQALNGIDVVQGKPTVSPQLAIALIRSRIPKAFIKIETDEAKLVSTATMARDRDRMDEAYTARWDMARAQKMGLTGKDNYQKQPATMLEWRATMQSARKVFPDIIKGLDNSPDEAEDYASATTGETKAQAITEALRSEPKEVKSEVVSTAPVIPSKEAEILDADPLADYEIPIGDLRGKRLKELDPVKLQDYLAKIHGHFQSKGQQVTGKWLEFVTRADMHLNAIAAHQPSEEGPSFEGFSS